MSPISQTQIEEKRAASINKIYDASLELFAKQGFQSTSISQIAKKAGISKGLIYNYFDSKVDLLKELMANFSNLEENIMANVVDEDPRKFLENLLRVFFLELRERSDLWKMIASLSLQQEMYEFIHDMALEKLNTYYVLLEQLLGKIGIKNPKGEAKLLAALFDGIGMHYIVIRGEYPLDEVEDYLINKYCKHE
jgi:AcrR family transcriptional regulator